MNLSRIDIEDSMIGLNGMMVRAFDSTKTYACEEIDFKILMGLCELEVSFAFVDIPTVFNLLLDRPWIHATGAIPSTLHQKVKLYQGISS